jgi:hypothetical protein
MCLSSLSVAVIISDGFEGRAEVAGRIWQKPAISCPHTLEKRRK